MIQKPSLVDLAKLPLGLRHKVIAMWYALQEAKEASRGENV